jgi:hypothetical protein
MSKLIAGLAVLFLLMAPDVNFAKGHHKSGSSSSDIGCSESRFDRCVNKCISRGGYGKKPGSNGACSERCMKKTKC